MPLNPRVKDDLNQALHRLFARDERTFLLGQDVADPYGGAFKVTAGLSTHYPDQVFSTPISENAIMGVANGLALTGNTVIVEIMFADFLTLAIDQLVNFGTKSVAMYGVRRPMHLVVRAPVGGNRGYGATHSQSLQKHLIGVPHLGLYELSPFHRPDRVFDHMLATGEPAMLFEQKTLYPERTFRDGRVDDDTRYEFVDDAHNWAHVFPTGSAGQPLLVIAPGGMAPRALAAAAELRQTGGPPVHLLVPAQLHPLHVTPIVDLVASARAVCVAEESTAGGTWGADLARLLYERSWGRLSQPIRLVHSLDSVIPAAPHLERAVLTQAGSIVAALTDLLGAAAAQEGSAPATRPAPVLNGASHPIQAPRLNANDTEYVLREWLVADGALVVEGDPVVELETSKAVEELTADRPGRLRQLVEVGQEVLIGTVIGRLVDPDTPAPTPIRGSGQGHADGASRDASAADAVRELGRGQRAVADMVAASRREIPDAFVVVEVRLDAVGAVVSELVERLGGSVGLPELLIKAVAGLQPAHPHVFGTLVNGAIQVAKQADVSVTIDAGTGLYTPVIRAADRRDLAEIADDLMEFRLRALRHRFRPDDLSGGTVGVSLNGEDGVVLVQPIIPIGHSCMLSLGGTRQALQLDPAGTVVPTDVVNLGLAYDHRILNGREAIAMLRKLKATLESPPDLLALAGS